MSVVSNQRRILLELLEGLSPYWHSDRNLPDRIRASLARDRRFGSRDRRLYRELMYTAVRYLPWIEPKLDGQPELATEIIAWLAADTADTRAFRGAVTAGWQPCPESVEARSRVLGEIPARLLPHWLEEENPRAYDPEEMDALHRRGPVWLRLQRDDLAVVREELEGDGWHLHPSEILPDAVEARHPTRPESDLTRSRSWKRGGFEIQDLGSQMVLASIGIGRGERWLDACAGAGGKTLQLARIVGSSGRVDAWDPRRPALEELERRRARARMRNVQILEAEPHPGPPDHPTEHARAFDRLEFDGVLVDAPCSGSGTWRRAPHLKWVTRPVDLERHAERQKALLGSFARLVRPGGLLVYATCSLARSENEAVAAAFLRETPNFEPHPPLWSFGYSEAPGGLHILPARHDTDGFFVATFLRKN